MMSISSSPLVMLVDDSQVDLFLNKKLLTLSKIADDIISFPIARNALDYLEQHSEDEDKLPDIILLDIKMPEINGFQFLDYINKLDKRLKKSIKIIMLSSSVDPKDINRAENNERVFDILKKPLDTDVLKQTLINKDKKGVA